MDCPREGHHGPAEGYQLFAEGIHIIFASEEAYHTPAIGQGGGHLGQRLSGDCRVGYEVAVYPSDRLGKRQHGLPEGNQVLSKGGQRRAAGQPGGQRVQNISRSEQQDCFCQGFHSIHHSGRDLACPFYKRLHIGHKVAQVRPDFRELTCNAAHKAADDTAHKASNGVADAFQQRPALIDQPVQAGDLCQGAYCGQYQCQFRNHCAHAYDAHHSAGD